nr:RNA-directed DNA polymerase, eukaryota, reverse transcriptase zinc-binding domain protein [Tanacetum cinerariifolium]
MNIIKEVESLSKQGIHVLNYLRIKLGDGKSSKFWCDSWSDEGVLKDMFPRVYVLESCKNITIADKVRQENPYQTFRRTPRGGVEQEQFQHVDRISRSVKLNSNNDSWTWNLEKSGMFSVASVRKMIDDALIHSPNLNYRWNKYVPIKVNILVWKILNNSLPTKFNISRRDAPPRLQNEDDLTDDDLKQYEADIEAMNLVFILVPNEIYNFVDVCQIARDMWDRYEKLVIASKAKKVAKTHDPLALVAHTSSFSSRSTPPYYVTHPPSVVYYDDDYQGDTLVNQVLTQADRVNIQSKNVRNGGRIARRSSNTQEESTNSTNVQKQTRNVHRTLRNSLSGNATNVKCYNCNAKGHYAQDCPKPRVWDSKYFMKQMLLAKKDEVGVILYNEHNDFLLADVAQMDEIKELSANICMMARIQQPNTDSDEGLSYDYAFISEVQTPSTSFMNQLFSKSDHEQMNHQQPKIINPTNGDDQINSDIILDDSNVKVIDGNVKHDKNAHDQHDNELELLARNAYKEAEKQLILAIKVKQQNVELTKQLEKYKERVWVFETTNANKTNFHK